MAGSFSAPAKLNLFLHIVGTRADNYHNIQTLFQLLNWGDDIQLAENEPKKDDISFEGPYAHQVPAVPRHNLIHRALALVRKKYGIEKRIQVRIYKRIPIAAGLGGASSDAASLLLALNKHWRLDLPLRELSDWGAQLGADIPLFIYGRTALAEGRGEQLSPFTVFPYYYLLVCPYLACSTGEFFSNPDLKITPPEKDLSRQADDFWLDEKYTNAFLPLVLKKYPSLRELYTRLNLWTPHKEGNRVLLSGSGSTFFMAYRQRKAAEAAYGILTRRIKSDTAYIHLAQGVQCRSEI